MAAGLLTGEQHIPLPVAMSNFLTTDNAPWNLLMAVSTVYSIPPVILYYLSGNKAIGPIRANLIVYYSFITCVAVPFFIYQGYVTWETFARWVVLTPPVLAGVYWGSHFFHGTNAKTFLRWSLATLLVSALVGIFG